MAHAPSSSGNPLAHQAFSGERPPELATVLKVTQALGLRLQVAAAG